MKQQIVFWSLIGALAVGYTALCVTPSPALQQAEPTVKSGHPACVSDELLTQFNGGNFTMQRQLISQGYCIHSESIQYEFETLGSGSVGVAQVRVYLPDDESVILFMPQEAVQ